METQKVRAIVSRMTLQADRLGDLISKKNARLTREEAKRFGRVRGNILNELQTLLCLADLHDHESALKHK